MKTDFKVSESEIREIFYKTKTFEYINSLLRSNNKYVDKNWKKIEQLEIFIEPEVFVESLANRIRDKVNSRILDDYWSLTIGETGSAKSSLDLMIYLTLRKKIEEDFNENKTYIDVVRFQPEYLARTNKRLFEEGDKILSGNIKEDVIILDEAHNVFDIFTSRSNALTRDLIKKAFQIREWKIIHLLNSQLPNQIAQRILKGKITNVIYTFFEEYDRKHPLYKYYEEYFRFLTGKEEINDREGKILFACYYRKDKSRKFLKLIYEWGESVLNPRRVLSLLMPDKITVHMFLFHKNRDVYQKYREIKAFSELVDSFIQMFQLRSYLSITPFYVLNEMIKENIDSLEREGSYFLLEESIPTYFLEEKEIKRLQQSKAFILSGDSIIGIHKNLYHIYKKFRNVIEKRKELYKYLFPELEIEAQ